MKLQEAIRSFIYILEKSRIHTPLQTLYISSDSASHLNLPLIHACGIILASLGISLVVGQQTLNL